MTHGTGTFTYIYHKNQPLGKYTSPMDPTWRIIPVSKWLVDLQAMERPFGRGPTTLLKGRKLTMVINHLLHPGMILQVGSMYVWYIYQHLP